MDNYELIRTAHRVYGRCISEVSEITGLSRNTVRKALHGEAWGYKERAHQPFPVLEPYLHLIDDWLKEDKKQPRKQRHTARRIYHRLVAELPPPAKNRPVFVFLMDPLRVAEFEFYVDDFTEIWLENGRAQSGQRWFGSRGETPASAHSW